MPYTNSVTINLHNYDYSSPRPSFAVTGNTYDSRLRFANKTSQFHVQESTYGYVVFRVSYTGPISYLSVCFRPENGQSVSVSTDLNGLYLMSSMLLPVEWKILDGTNTTPNPSTFYVVVNVPQALTDILDVSIAAGVFGTPPTDSSVTIDYSCVTQINTYVTGLHVYSPYDAQGSISKLRTILYSMTPIQNWTYDTMVWNSPNLQNPALPWYYGYGDYVYKIGGPFDRAFGNQVRYRIKKKNFQRPKKTREIVGPQWWIVDPTTEPYHPNCVAPIMTDLGLVKQIYLASTLPKPPYYRYYMGYDPTDSVASNNSVFDVWSWTTSQNYPIIGSKHALLKLLSGIMEGYRYSGGYFNDFQFNYNPFDNDLGYAGFALISAGTATFALAELCKSLVNCDPNCPSNQIPTSTVPGHGGVGCPTDPSGPGSSGNNTSGGYGGDSNIPALCKICNALELLGLGLLALGGLFLLIDLIISWFTHYTHYYVETCTNILHFFCDTPYVSGDTRTTLYRNINISHVLPGWHNDGCYKYYQSGGFVVSKNVNEIPRGFEYETAAGVVWAAQRATQPDVPTLVTDFKKLVILCYTSGKPLPYCGRGLPIYYNSGSTTTISPKDLDCCDLELCNPVVITLPSATTWSCISQADAEAQAQLLFNYQVQYAISHHTTIPLADSAYGEIDVIFSHELKIEDIPTYDSLTFDARISQTPRIGMKLYYDSYGCTLTLDGYYATTGNTISSPYRTFYHTKNGVVDAIELMLLPTSTTTVSGKPIITLNRDYTSNWYLTETDSATLNTWSNQLVGIRHFNPNVLYTPYTLSLLNGASHTYTLKKGFIKTPSSHNNFQLYTDFVNTTYSEAPYGWYRPLITWLDEAQFLYQQNGRVLYLNIEEDCGYIVGSTSARGVHVTCVDSNGVITGIDTNMSIGINIYDVNGVIVNTSQVLLYLNQGQSTQFFNLSNIIRPTTDVGSIVITNINILIPTNTNYTPGTSSSCTVKICNQIWMTHNLDVSHYTNGDLISEVSDATEWSNLSRGAYCYYNNDSSNNSTYGKLYNWYAVNDPRGLAPRGWHIPHPDEFMALSACLGGDAISGGHLKEIGTNHWSFPNTGADNLSNFTALPGGMRLVPQLQPQPTNFIGLNIYANFWTNRLNVANLAYYRYCSWNDASFVSSSQTIKTGFSVRCVKD